MKAFVVGGNFEFPEPDSATTTRVKVKLQGGTPIPSKGEAVLLVSAKKEQAVVTITDISITPIMEPMSGTAYFVVYLTINRPHSKESEGSFYINVV